MQKSKMNYVLFPIPAEVLEELELDEYDTIQYSVSNGRLIIEQIEGDRDMVCLGKCCDCPGRRTCRRNCGCR